MNCIHKYGKKIVCIITLATLMLCIFSYFEHKPNAYEIKMNDEFIAYVDNLDLFKKHVNELEKEINKKFKDFKFTDKFTYSKIHIEYKFLTTKNHIEKNIINNSKTKVEALQAKKSIATEDSKATTGKNLKLLRPCKGRVSSPFGIRNGKLHKGMDIANNTGAPIYAAYDGVISYVGWISGYGKTVKVDHGEGLETIYAHCSTLKVKKDQQVKSGDKIGEVGSTGRSTGPHVHFEVRINGVPQNPAKYMKS